MEPSVPTHEQEIVMRLYYAIGSSESILILKEIINAHRQQKPDKIIDKRDISPPERRQALDRLEYDIALSILLKRCHYVRLGEALGLRDIGFVAQHSNIGIGQMEA